jgi:hypothetical protein
MQLLLVIGKGEEGLHMKRWVLLFFALYQSHRVTLEQRDMEWIFPFAGAKTRNAAKLLVFPLP